LEKIIKKARFIEFLLYNEASTFEEYTDRSTFHRRFVAVLRTCRTMNHRTRINDRIIEKI